MPSDNPHTPQSPSQTTFSVADLPPKPTSPRNTHSLPTPAHSINGSMSSVSSGPPTEGLSHDESSNKRKRGIEDLGDRDLKKVHVEDSRFSIEDLHIDVGKKYHLCKTQHPRERADVTTDMFERYGLADLAKSVARKDENSQGGIKMRKSYKTFLKNLSGNFDVHKKELDAADSLISMLIAPTEEWDAQYRGAEIEKGLPKETLASMGSAFTMAKGVIPRARWSSVVLGEVAAPPVPKASKPVSNFVKPTHAHSASHAAKEIPRPKRNVKKRAYGDSSYEGYGEGYVDDDLQDTGYSTGDGEDRSGSRKRPKKSSTNHNYPPGPLRQNSYGPGMVGA